MKWTRETAEQWRTANPLLRSWNLDFTKQRRQNMREKMRGRLTCRPKGRGNKAWKRAGQLWLEPGCIIWPDYALPFATRRPQT